jgi:hypothetical protein
MANWTTRKSKSQRVSKNTNFRSTETFTYGKGITNSQSFGGKNGRTTFSTGPKGTKVYTTVRSGDMYQRSSRTLSSVKNSRVRKGRKMTKKEAQAWAALLSSPVFWFVAIIVFILLGVA